MKNYMIPVFVFILGTGAAFASQKSKANFTGYHQVQVGEEITCVADKNCTDIDTGTICTWSVDGVTPLRKLDSPSMCVQTLYEIVP